MKKMFSGKSHAYSVILTCFMCCHFTLFAQNPSIPEPVLKEGKAVFKCQFRDYDPTKIERFIIILKRPIEGRALPTFHDVDKNGYLETEIDLIAPTQVEINSNFMGGCILLTPGEESSLEVKMKDVIAERDTLTEGAPENMDHFIFSGANADINNKLASDQVSKIIYKDYGQEIEMIKGFLGMSLDDYKKFHLLLGEKKMKTLDSLKVAMDIPDPLYEMLRLRIDYQVLDYLMQADTYLPAAIKMAQNEGTLPDNMKDIAVPPIDINYFSFLKDYPVNNKISLYAPEYETILSYCRYILFKLSEDGRVAFKESYFLDYLEKSVPLQPDDVRLVKELKKQDILSWNKTQINDYKKSEVIRLQAIIDSKKLPEDQLKEAKELITVVSKVKTAEDAYGVDSRMIEFQKGLVDHYIVTMAFIEEVTRKNSPESISVQVDDKEFNDFYDKYTDVRERFTSNWLAMKNNELLAEILGTDRGFLFDMLYMEQLIDQADKGIHPDKAEIDKLSSMDPFYWKYLTNRQKKEDNSVKFKYNESKGKLEPLE